MCLIMDSLTCRISSFQSLGTVDGPGIRAVVFMQGCPLRCHCCHNPETWETDGGEEITAEELLQKILRCKSYFGLKGGVTF
jgi:pyruvate formate lyase activating enzyme